MRQPRPGRLKGREDAGAGWFGAGSGRESVAQSGHQAAVDRVIS